MESVLPEKKTNAVPTVRKKRGKPSKEDKEVQQPSKFDTAVTEHLRGISVMPEERG